MPTPYVIILAVLTIIVSAISLKTDKLRNTVFNLATIARLAKKHGRKERPAFSLAKTQLAFWSVVIIGSYFYVAFFTPGLNGIRFNIEIGAVNLTLLGIAAGTTVVGKAIDSNQQSNTKTDPNDKQQNHPGTGFFFVDIISDETGVSIHRLQNVIWTLVVGVVYIAFVSSNCVLPDDKVITNTLLGLMGISSAAYLGVKTKENTAPQPQPEPDDDTNKSNTANTANSTTNQSGTANTGK